MSITVVGSLAFDSVVTPAGSRDRMLGGAATHFALAASLFAPVRVVGPVGDDFGDAEFTTLGARGTDTTDVERVAGGRTFFWKGEYGSDLNTRETLATELNVFEDFDPKLSPEARACDVLFLANIQPELQLKVLEQCDGPRFTAVDSMNLWIDIARDALMDVISRVDCVLLNDEEVLQLTGAADLDSAGREILEWGPSVVVAKQGEHGATLFTGDEVLSVPAHGVDDVVDPTGAGDTFAGGFVGSIAKHLPESVDADALRQAMAHGTALGSFNVEAFGTGRTETLALDEVEARAASVSVG